MTRRSGSRRSGVLVAALAVALLLWGCSGSGGSDPGSLGVTPAGGPSGSSGVSGSSGTSPTAIAPTTSAGTGSTAGPTVKGTSIAQVGSGLSALDRLAGLQTLKVPWNGGGTLKVVPGHSAAPGRGRIYRIRVEVETGLKLDRVAFADYVLATLNDKRSWTDNGRRRFARTDGRYDIRVVLASPATSAAICRPLQTFGKLSCRSGDAAVLTMYRWTKAIPHYAGNHDGYRHYVINHEVGHALGHGHQYCAGPGRIAPVMMQQTKGLKGCKPNPWPHP